MAVDLRLAEMSVDDKLQAMEQLWADLSQNPEHLASPAWHGEVLRSRREQVLQALPGTDPANREVVVR